MARYGEICFSVQADKRGNASDISRHFGEYPVNMFSSGGVVCAMFIMMKYVSTL